MSSFARDVSIKQSFITRYSVLDRYIKLDPVSGSYGVINIYPYNEDVVFSSDSASS